MGKFTYLIAVLLMGTVYPVDTWANPNKCNSLLKDEDSFMQTLDPLVRKAFESIDSARVGRAVRVVKILTRFKYTSPQILVAAVLSGKSPDAELQNIFGIDATNTLTALKIAGDQPLNDILPQLLITNPDAAAIRIAERSVDVEDAIIAISQGRPEARRKYRDEFVSTPLEFPPDRDDLWRYWNGLCQHKVPTAAFALGDVYIDYPFEKVKFRYEFNTRKKFRKFYREHGVEEEISESSTLFEEARMDGNLISKAEYDAK